MNSTITVIQTTYKGYRFRSRLEARWAVFFEAASIKWEYETQGYDLGAAGWYLPDFWLSESNLWIEIKPVTPSETEKAKACALQAADPEQTVVILSGSPWREIRSLPEYCAWIVDRNWSVKDDLVYRCHPDSDVQFLECFGCNRVQLIEILGSRYYCPNCDLRIRPKQDVVGDHGWHFHKGDWVRDRYDEADSPLTTARLMNAYTAARSARFEHGESG